MVDEMDCIANRQIQKVLDLKSRYEVIYLKANRNERRYGRIITVKSGNTHAQGYPMYMYVSPI